MEAKILNTYNNYFWDAASQLHQKQVLKIILKKKHINHTVRITNTPKEQMEKNFF